MNPEKAFDLLNRDDQAVLADWLEDNGRPEEAKTVREHYALVWVDGKVADAYEHPQEAIDLLRVVLEPMGFGIHEFTDSVILKRGDVEIAEQGKAGLYYANAADIIGCIVAHGRGVDPDHAREFLFRSSDRTPEDYAHRTWSESDRRFLYGMPISVGDSYLYRFEINQGKECFTLAESPPYDHPGLQSVRYATEAEALSAEPDATAGRLDNVDDDLDEDGAYQEDRLLGNLDYDDDYQFGWGDQ